MTARRGNLNDAHVVEGALVRVEIWVRPVGHKHGVTDRVGVARIGDVNGAADGTIATAVLNGSIVGTAEAIINEIGAALEM